MTQAQLLTATRILERTMPAMSRRLLIYGAISFGFIFAILMGAGALYGLASFSDNPGLWGQAGAVFGLGAALYAYRLTRPLLFHHLDLVQLMAMVKRIQGEDLPAGKEQIAHLQNSLSTLFPSPRQSFQCYESIRQVVTEAFAAIPPGDRLTRLAIATLWQRGLAMVLLWFTADAILATALPKLQLAAIRRGALALCQHYPTILRRSLVLNIFLYGMLLAAFWLLLKPVGWVDTALPSELGIWKYVFAGILTHWVKVVFLDPIVIAAMSMTLLPLAEDASGEAVTAWTSRVPALGRLPDE